MIIKIQVIHDDGTEDEPVFVSGDKNYTRIFEPPIDDVQICRVLVRMVPPLKTEPLMIA